MLEKEYQEEGFFSWRVKVALMVTMFLVMVMAMAMAMAMAIGDSDVDGGDKFDYFVFLQEWPGMYCEAKASCCRDAIWPEFDDGKSDRQFMAA